MKILGLISVVMWIGVVSCNGGSSSETAGENASDSDTTNPEGDTNVVIGDSDTADSETTEKPDSETVGNWDSETAGNPDSDTVENRDSETESNHDSDSGPTDKDTNTDTDSNTNTNTDTVLTHSDYVKEDSRVFPSALIFSDVLLDTSSQGNIVATGATSDSVALGDDVEPSENKLTFILMLSPSGEELVRWIYPHINEPKAFFVTTDDKAVLVGNCSETAAIGAEMITGDGNYLAIIDLATGEADLFVPVPNAELFWLYAIAGDAAGNIYITGAGLSTMNGGTVSVANYSSTGEHVWTNTFSNCDSTIYFADIEVVPDATVVGVGAFNCGVQFGDQSFTTLAAKETGAYNGFISWLDGATGSATNSKQFGGVVFDYLKSIDVVNADTYRITGNIRSTVAFGGETFEGHEYGSAFVAEITREGLVTWKSVFDDDSVVFDSTTDAWGRTHMVGRIDGIPHTDRIDSEGSHSFVASFDADGTPLRVHSFQTNANGGRRVAVDGEGGIWVLGEFKGTMELPQGTFYSEKASTYLVRFDAPGALGAIRN